MKRNILCSAVFQVCLWGFILQAPQVLATTSTSTATTVSSPTSSSTSTATTQTSPTSDSTTTSTFSTASTESSPTSDSTSTSTSMSTVTTESSATSASTTTSTATTESSATSLTSDSTSTSTSSSLGSTTTSTASTESSATSDSTTTSTGTTQSTATSPTSDSTTTSTATTQSTATSPTSDSTSTSTATTESSATSGSSSTSTSASSLSSGSTSSSTSSSPSSGSTASTASSTSSVTSESSTTTSSATTVSSSVSSGTSTSTATSTSESSSSSSTSVSTESTATTTSTTVSTEEKYFVATRVVGSIKATVSDCDAYVVTVQVNLLWRRSLAALAGCPLSWITVTLTCVEGNDQRRLTQDGNVDVQYTIEVPSTVSEDSELFDESAVDVDESQSEDYFNNIVHIVTLNLEANLEAVDVTAVQSELATQQAEGDFDEGTADVSVVEVADAVVTIETTPSTSTSTSTTSTETTRASATSTTSSSTSESSATSTSGSSTTTTTSVSTASSQSTDSSTSSRSTGSSKTSGSSTSTSTSFRSTTTTTSVSTEFHHYSEVRFTVQMEVTNEAQFAEDSAVLQALIDILAAYLDVPASQVEASLRLVRRLSESRHLTSTANVEVDYVVRLPKDSSQSQQDVVSSVEQLSSNDYLSRFNAALGDAGVDASQYSTQVLDISSPTVELFTSTSSTTVQQSSGGGGDGDESGAGGGIIALIVILVLLALAVPAFLICWYIKRRGEHAGEDPVDFTTEVRKMVGESWTASVARMQQARAAVRGKKGSGADAGLVDEEAGAAHTSMTSVTPAGAPAASPASQTSDWNTHDV